MKPETNRYGQTTKTDSLLKYGSYLAGFALVSCPDRRSSLARGEERRAGHETSFAFGQNALSTPRQASTRLQLPFFWCFFFADLPFAVEKR